MKKDAIWIASPVDTGVAACTFEKKFTLDKPVKKATLRATAMGTYVPKLNGCRLGKGVLAPGWTCYKERVQYQTYDVTGLLKDSNTISIGVGQGWAIGDIGFKSNNHYFADQISLLAWLDIVFADGTRQCVATGTDWQVYTNEVTLTEIYHGETVDKTAEIKLLGNARIVRIGSKVIPQVGENITEQEHLAPVALIVTPKGERVIDFGQNMTGYVQVSVTAPRGSRIVLHHAEVLDSEGNFYNANYRHAKNEMTYICSGEADVFKPSYTFQGFRYIRLTEYPFETVDLDNFTAIAVNSDMKRTGYYRCGNEKINQLYHNIIWGQKSNYLDIPTDCPQRDERLGWTGDAQVFCRTAAINFDIEKFMEKWLGDMAIDQAKENGIVRGVIPVTMKHPTRISAAWGDAACIIPWQIYEAYGSKKLLKQHLPMMKAWVDYLHLTGPAEFLWLGGMHYGDWLAMDAGEDSYVGATSNDLIASAFFAYSCSLVVKAGKVLGEDVSDYEALYANVRKAFREYFMENGMPKEEFPLTEATRPGHAMVDTVRKGVTQTAITLILHFGLCEEEERPALAAKLVELIKDFGGCMATGFVGTPYLLHVLSAHGYTDVAYSLLMQERNPSWLYSVTHGATTMWEHWNSLKEDGSFWSTDMNSFNHYAYGAVFDWIFGVSSGIKPVAEDPAYKTVEIAPQPSKCLGWADASIESRNGLIRSYWYYKGDTVYYEFDIPAGVTATVQLPSGKQYTLSGGSYRFAE
jgi:alpha-L-rhamnosidase